MRFLRDLKYRFEYASPVLKLIMLNALVFGFALLLNLFAFLFFQVRMFSVPFLALPSGWGMLLQKPWTLLSYQFTHFGAFHFAFNMLVLHFSGNIFLDFFRKNDAWRVYLWGGVTAALFFILASNYIPAFRGSDYTLYGASGSVMAVLFAATVYAPDIRLHLFGIFQVKLFWIAIAYFVLDLLSISESNAGGHIAHIGGAVFGIAFAYYRKASPGDAFSGLFGVRAKAASKARVTVHTQKIKSKPSVRKKDGPSQEEIDAILDKISRSGYDRLTREEKDLLFKASQD